MPKVRSNGQLGKEDAALQAQAMLIPRIAHTASLAEIAAQFNVSTATVKKRLAEARQSEFAALAQEIVMERMLPKALSVIEMELDKGNYDAAKDLLQGMQVYQKGGKATIEHITSNSPTLDQIRAERAKVIEAKAVPIEPEG